MALFILFVSVSNPPTNQNLRIKGCVNDTHKLGRGWRLDNPRFISRYAQNDGYKFSFVVWKFFGTPFFQERGRVYLNRSPPFFWQKEAQKKGYRKKTPKQEFRSLRRATADRGGSDKLSGKFDQSFPRAESVRHRKINI